MQAAPVVTVQKQRVWRVQQEPVSKKAMSASEAEDRVALSGNWRVVTRAPHHWMTLSSRGTGSPGRIIMFEL